MTKKLSNILQNPIYSTTVSYEHTQLYIDKRRSTEKKEDKRKRARRNAEGGHCLEEQGLI